MCPPYVNICGINCVIAPSVQNKCTLLTHVVGSPCPNSILVRQCFKQSDQWAVLELVISFPFFPVQFGPRLKGPSIVYLFKLISIDAFLPIGKRSKREQSV